MEQRSWVRIWDSQSWLGEVQSYVDTGTGLLCFEVEDSVMQRREFIRLVGVAAGRKILFIDRKQRDSSLCSGSALRKAKVCSTKINRAYAKVLA